jgi:hypothetical protein
LPPNAERNRASTVGKLALPYHYDVLAAARQLLDADKDDVAVIMAQTAREIATDDIIRTLMQH